MLIQNNTIFELIVSDAIYNISYKITIKPMAFVVISKFKCIDIYIKNKAFRRLSTKKVLKVEATYEKILKYKKDGDIISNSWCELPLCCTSCFKHYYKKNIDEYLEECKTCNLCITINEDIYKCYHN